METITFRGQTVTNAALLVETLNKEIQLLRAALKTLHSGTDQYLPDSFRDEWNALVTGRLMPESELIEAAYEKATA